MRWLMVVRNLESNRLEIIGPDTEIDFDDPRYEKVVNIVPFEKEPTSLMIDFGVHDLCEMCACHPKITKSDFGDIIISHKAAVN
jgi:hypothetical protein